MALASTIALNPDGSLTPTGIVLAVPPLSDQTAPLEIWRAPDSAGAPNAGAAVLVATVLVPPAGMSYVDLLPLDGAVWWYRMRVNGGIYGAGAYTPWLNGGIAATLPLRDVGTSPPAPFGGGPPPRELALPGHTRTLLDALSYLVVNGEFSVWQSAALPRGWSVDPGDNSVCTQDTTVVFSGDAAAKYSFGAGGSAGTYRGLTTNDPVKGPFCLPLKPGVAYRVKLSVRCSSVAGTPDYRVTLTHDVAGSLTNVRTVLFAAATTWQTDEFVFTVPAGAEPNSRLAVEFKRGNTSAQDFWVDSLRADEIGLMVNPVVDLGTKSSAFTVDLSAGDSQQVILAASVLAMTFVRPVDGARYRIAYQQDTTGSRLLPTHGDTVMWVNDTAPTLSTAPGAIDLIEYTYRANPTPRYIGVVLAQNLQLPSPRVQDEGGQAFSTQTMTHNVNLSGAVNAGDLLLIIFGTDSAQGTTPPTTPAGWTQIATQTWNNQNIITVLGKIADGTEGGTSVNVATSANCRAESIRYRIDRWYGSLAGVVKGGGATGTSTAPDPGSLTPGWTDRSLWMAVCGSDANTSVSTGPTNYATPIGGSSTGTPVVAVFSARRTLYAAAENPAAYTLAASSNWGAFTLAIRPPA